MKKTALVLTLAAAGTLAFTGTASAQDCGYGYGFCAQVQIGVPQPPVVYVQPYAPPPPRVVYVQPAPPPPQVYYVRPRPVVYYQPSTVAVASPVVVMSERQIGLGLHLSAAAVNENEDPMGGFGAHIRYRLNPRFAVEGTLDLFHGLGVEGLERSEVPLTLNGMWYVNPQNRLQLYMLAGVGVASAHIGSDDSAGGTVDTAFAGVQAGIGAELRLGRHIAVSADVRGFLRGRLNDDYHPEEAACREDGCTPYEGGATFNAAGTLYF